MEDLIIVVLRLLHIVMGALWFGVGVCAAWVLMPAAERMGDKGFAMLRTFYISTRFNMLMPIVSIGTTLVGVILWILRSSSITDLEAFTSTGDLVMIFGALMGLAAFGHGGAATGKYADEFAALAQTYEENPTEENLKTLQAVKEKVRIHGNISAWIVLIAILCMSGARYLA